MQEFLQIVIVVCCFGFGWTAGSSQVFQDREFGCASIWMFMVFLVTATGLVWSVVAGSDGWFVWAMGLGALIAGGFAAALRKRY